LPKYFGYVSALWTLIPALIVLLTIEIFDDSLVQNSLMKYMQSENIQLEGNFNLYLNEIKNITDISSIEPTKAKVYQHYAHLQNITTNAKTVVVLALAVLMGVFGFKKVTIDTPARIYFEKFIEIILLLAASIAILTTVGIVFSVLFESVRFFGEVPVMDFMFGLE